MDTQLDSFTVTWKHLIIALGIVAALSSGGGAAVAGFRPSGVSAADLTSLEDRREKRLLAERERIDATYADGHDVTRLAVQIGDLERRVGELALEVRALRGALRE